MMDRLQGQLEKWAYRRAADDLKRDDWQWTFNSGLANKAISTIQSFRQSKGKWAGQKLVLSPWQVFCTQQMFGWVHKGGEFSGKRRFTSGYKTVARKNGKSTYGAGVGNVLFAFDGEPGAEVYTCATKLEQARIVHKEAIRMMKQTFLDVPELEADIDIFKSIMSFGRTNSTFEPLGSDSDRLDGLNPSGAIIDEYHAHKNDSLLQVIETGMAAREQPLTLVITTAGFGQMGPCFELDQHCRRVLDPEDATTDDRRFIFIARPDLGDDWHDERIWEKGNPNLRISVFIDYLRNQHQKALRGGSNENNFLVKNCNIWTQQAERWISLDAWDKCRDTFGIGEFIGQPVWCGLDLAASSDFTAMAIVGDGPRIKWLYWFPEDSAERTELKRGIPLREWARQGWLTITPGATTDYNIVRRDINALAKSGIGIREIAVDRLFQGSQVIIDLMADGFDAFSFPQSFSEFAAPSKRLEELVLSGGIVQDGNPVTRWMVDNVTTKTDPQGNLMPDRKKSVDKIDGVVAAIMALSRFTIHEDGSSVYDTKGIVAF